MADKRLGNKEDTTEFLNCYGDLVSENICLVYLTVINRLFVSITTAEALAISYSTMRRNESGITPD